MNVSSLFGPQTFDSSVCGPFVTECGEGGIRTPGTVSGTQHFQCCTIGHSVTSPESLPPAASKSVPHRDQPAHP